MKNVPRYEEAKRLRDSGLSFKAVGEVLGVSGSRARDMVADQERRVRWAADEAANPTPPVWWDGLKYRTKWELARSGINSKEECSALAAEKLTMWRGSVALPGWEKHKAIWSCSERKLKLSVVNEVRAWLGVAPYVPGPRIASDAEIDRARRLLEKHGWRVEAAK